MMFDCTQLDQPGEKPMDRRFWQSRTPSDFAEAHDTSFRRERSQQGKRFRENRWWQVFVEARRSVSRPCL
jgi:hypothetical protein